MGEYTLKIGVCRNSSQIIFQLLLVIEKWFVKNFDRRQVLNKFNNFQMKKLIFAVFLSVRRTRWRSETFRRDFNGPAWKKKPAWKQWVKLTYANDSGIVSYPYHSILQRISVVIAATNDDLWLHMQDIVPILSCIKIHMQLQ